MNKKRIALKFKNNSGQGVMEYLILSALIGIFCLGAVGQFGKVIRERINDMKSEIVNIIPSK